MKFEGEEEGVRKKKKKRKKIKEKTADGRMLAAGRFHLPAVVGYWIKKGCGVLV